jgi:hypothetical protein
MIWNALASSANRAASFCVRSSAQSNVAPANSRHKRVEPVTIP